MTTITVNKPTSFSLTTLKEVVLLLEANLAEAGAYPLQPVSEMIKEEMEIQDVRDLSAYLQEQRKKVISSKYEIKDIFDDIIIENTEIAFMYLLDFYRAPDMSKTHPWNQALKYFQCSMSHNVKDMGPTTHIIAQKWGTLYPQENAMLVEILDKAA